MDAAATHESRLGDMTQRVVLVTGASSGIGAAIVREMLDAGARVHGVARRAEELDAAGAVGIPSGRYVPHVVDVMQGDAVRTLATDLAERDPIDTLVLAAGTNVTRRRFEELGHDDWDLLVELNLTSTFRLLQAVLPQLRETRGHAVIIASVSAQWPDLSGAAYQATKAGVLALARAVSWEEHARGVRVSTILPGVVDTPLVGKRPEQPSPEARAQFMQPRDVALACLAVVTMPARATISELTILASTLQTTGRTI